MLCDTGAFCNCISLKFYQRVFPRMTSPKLNPSSQNFSAANNSPLNVAGSAQFSVKLGGRTIRETFFVVDGLSQDVILGIGFLQNCRAVLDFCSKRMRLFDGAANVPLATAVDGSRAVRTIKRLRIPALTEVMFPARPPPQNPAPHGVTETLPSTLSRGLKVAGAIVDCSQPAIMCRVANPTTRPILWPAGHAFAYISPLDTSAVGVNLIDATDIIQNTNTDVNNDESHAPHTNGGPNDDNSRDARGSRALPPHDERLKVLRKLGVQIGDTVMNQNQAEAMSQLLYEYRDIMASNYMDVPEARVPRHKIPLTDDKPVIQKRFRYDPAKEQKLEDLCDELRDAGIIKESTSPWNSPVFLLTKPDKSSRFLVDFRAVNAKTSPEYCALPSLEDVFDQISDEKPTIFSVLDLKCGYYGIGLDADSQKCTAFSTKNRHFQFTRLNMGYVNSGAFFTQSLYQIFAAEVRRNMIIYVDDIFIMHRNVDDHIEFLRHIFAKFRDYRLRLHPKKMSIATDKANFLGYTLHAGGYTVDTGRCKIIKEYPRPKNAREVKKFLGISNYFRRLIHNYSKRSAPLRALMAKDVPFVWSESQEQSFCDIRDSLCSAPVLGYPDRDKPMRIILDACQTGLGYILVNVLEDGTEVPLFYGGRSTTRAERNYSATELELTALLSAVKTYRSYLANTEFEIVTDHISLTYIQKLQFGPHSKLVRASLLLDAFRFKISHLAGKNNSAADAISRTDNLQTDPLTLHEDARFQADDATDLRLDFASEASASGNYRSNQSDTCVQGDIGLHGEAGPVDSPDVSSNSSNSNSATGIPSVTTENETARSARPASKAARSQCHGQHPMTTVAHVSSDDSPPQHSTDDGDSPAAPQGDSGTADDVLSGDPCNGQLDLQTQHRDDQLAMTIDYLQQGILPADNKQARRIVITSEDFTIKKNLLLHLGTKRQKRARTSNRDQSVTEQVCIPGHMQPTILARYHSQLMHCGAEKLYLTMKERVYWPGMYTQVQQYVAQCEVCNRSKADFHPSKAQIQCREVPPQIFSRVHLDHVHIPVKNTTHGYNYALVLIDATSLWTEMIPVRTTSAKETCQAILMHWIARYGTPSELVTDRHPSFTGKLMELLLKACGIRHLLITPYNSRANGQVEKAHAILIQGLRVHCRNLTDWPSLLPAIAGAYRAGIIPNRACSPFKLLFGTEMRLPVETALGPSLPAHQRPTENIDMFSRQLATMRTDAQALAQAARKRQAKIINKQKQTPEFKTGDKVYRRRDVLGDDDDRKTARKYEGPYVIVERGPFNVYKLKHIYTGKILRNFIHVDKLKNCQHMRADKRRSINVINRNAAHIPRNFSGVVRGWRGAGNDPSRSRDRPTRHVSQTTGGRTSRHT